VEELCLGTTFLVADKELRDCNGRTITRDLVKTVEVYLLFIRKSNSK